MHAEELSSSLNCGKYKVVLLGDSGVGKSSIIDCLVKGQIDHHHQPTLGIDFISRNVLAAGKTYKLQLWDTAGQEKYRSLVPAYLKDADSALLVFDLASPESFDNLPAWLALLREHAPPPATLLLLANKADLHPLAAAPHAEAIATYARQQELTLIETSAKSGLNIPSIFEEMIHQIQRKEGVGRGAGGGAGGGVGRGAGGRGGAGGEVNEELSEGEAGDSNAYNFFLKYNRARFTHERKRGNCCYI